MTTTTVALDSAPSLPRLYARALATARLRRGEGDLPATRYRLDGVSVDRERLLGYDDVCGFRLADTLPPTYPHVLAFPLAMRLMTDSGFPFELPGLVHVANRIEQRRVLSTADVLTVEAWLDNLRSHERGSQFDAVSQVSVGTEVVWTDTSTYLKRGRDSTSGRRSSRKPEPVPQPTAIWQVRGDTGRRYAAVSGDSNPIHLHPLAARLFGFPRAIAHGMWAKARCLAALEGRLPDDLDVHVEFRAPLWLPSRVAFAAERSGDEWRFEVRAARSGRLHLAGTAGRLRAAATPDRR